METALAASSTDSKDEGSGTRSTVYNVESVSVIVSTSRVEAAIRDQELQFEDFSLGFAEYDTTLSVSYLIIGILHKNAMYDIPVFNLYRTGSCYRCYRC